MLPPAPLLPRLSFNLRRSRGARMVRRGAAAAAAVWAPSGLQAPASPSGAGCRRPVSPVEVQTPPPCCPQQQDPARPFSQRAGALVLEPLSGLGCGCPRTWLAHICWRPRLTGAPDAADADRLPWEGPQGGGGHAVGPWRTSAEEAPACLTAHRLPTQEGHLPRAAAQRRQGADQEGRVCGGLRSR